MKFVLENKITNVFLKMVILNSEKKQKKKIKKPSEKNWICFLLSFVVLA